MSERPETLLQAVSEAARRAGRVALSHFRSRIDVEIKPDGSPVTAADRLAEEAAREWIAARFPGDSVLGEEFGATGDDRGRRWYIDPIDGTKSFVRGVPLWGTLVAVAEGDDVLAGAIYCAAVNEMVAAAVGEGCWWNGSKTTVSSVGALAAATVLITSERFPDRPERRALWSTLAAEAAVVRTWGDCYGYLLVATGRADVMVDNRVTLWDAAALLPVIREAGGEFTDWRGITTAFGGDAIATNAALAIEVRSRLGIPYAGPSLTGKASSGGARV